MKAPLYCYWVGARLSARPVAVCLALVAYPFTASDAAEDDFVSTGGEVLRERLQIPWYDAKTDALEPIEITVPWELDLSWLGQSIYWLIMFFVAALALLVAWLVVRAARERSERRARAIGTADPLLIPDRIEALPFLRERSLHDLLGQARRHYEEGNYSEAIVYLFSYQLVELDRTALIRLARGKTNRQYLREAGQVRPMKSLLERTMVTFEDVFFGRRTFDRAGFEACWNQLGEFENLVGQAPAIA